MQKPNILFILTDDQGYWSLGAYGNTECRTPNLDKLAARGMRFDSFFCASPVCSPARASILTGRIPSQHGVHDWLCAGDTSDTKLESKGEGKLIEYLAGQPGYTDVLADNGYTCGLSGKWHLGDCHHAQKGHTFWEAHAKGGGPYYNAPMIRDGEIYTEPRYVTDAITDNALTFLNGQTNDDAPFYLGVHYTAPHAPWTREHHPADIYDDYFDNCPFTSVPDGLEPPEWAEHIAIPVEDSAKRRSFLSGYYASITAMDANVGKLIDWLETHGQLENTLVVFTTDNGMNMGHHGIYGKGNATFPLNMFEESVRVPFLVSRPGHVPEGEVCNELMSHYDVMPTLLDYVGYDTPDNIPLPGQSFAPMLKGESCAGHDRVVIFDEYGPVRMIRAREWKYIHRYPFGHHELYDLVNDPSETANLIHEPEQAERVAEMRKELTAWFNRYADPEIDGSRQGVTGKGQMNLARDGGAKYGPLP
jgi:choline-sulfatase